MPPQTPVQTRKLVLFVATVVASVAIILTLNVVIHDRTAAFSEGAGTPLRAGLERLAANPTKCAMTMEPSPDNERPMRHVNAGIVGKVDVLVLGQSEADHMSRTFFNDDVRFYNGFVSNSYFVYQYEVFLDLANAHGAPPLVLFDVRSGYILKDGQEPEWDTPAKSPLWWGFPPFHLGKAAPPPWYKDVPSLLSLAQTELTLTWFAHQLPTKPPPPDSGTTEADNGRQFRCVSQAEKSGMYRWLADGSRIYAGELDGVLAPHGPMRVSEAVGDRRINETRLQGLDFALRKIREAGSTVIVYSPPLAPESYEDPKQSRAIGGAVEAIRKVTDAHGVDYCDLTFKSAAIGCVAGDFSDEIHLGRHCDRRVVREIALGCAPHAGALLKPKLAPATLE